MMHNNNVPTLPALSITISAEKISRFATVLQAGFICTTTNDLSVSSLLGELPGFSYDYINNRLQTVFLNGDALDDFDVLFPEDAAVLALSAAMPGLAGAIFRKSSPAAGLRKPASLKKRIGVKKRISVLVKYFNDIAIEKGPDALANGVVFKAAELCSFLKLRPSLIEAMKEIKLEGQPVNTDEFLRLLSHHDKLILICKTAHD